MKKSNPLKAIGIIVAILLILLAGIPLILEHFVFRNSVYSVLTNGEWASFLGSYIGGVVGGAGTLIALWVTPNETRKIQEENLNQLNADRSLNDRKERKQFADIIAQDISIYIANINNYFYASRHSERLDNDRRNADIRLNDIRNKIKYQYGEQEKINIETDTNEYARIELEIEKLKVSEAEASQKLQHIEDEIDKNRVDRTIANERLNILKIRLQGIPEAAELIAKLEYIHKYSSGLGTEFDFMDKETSQLLAITSDFTYKYINRNT